MMNIDSYINREGLKNSYAYREGKTPVLFIPGFGCHHSIYTPMIECFADDSFELIVIDNRGMGQFRQVQEGYSLEDLANDCIDLMNELGHDTFHVVGTSMGGFVAQILALNYSAKIKSLGLLCTTSNDQSFIPIKIYTEQELRAFNELDPSLLAQISTERLVHESFIKEHSKEFSRIVDLRFTHRAQIDQLLWQRDAVANFMEREQALAIEKISVPTLVLSGDRDRFVDPDNANIFKEKISHAQVTFIKNTDHLFFMEKSRAVTKHLRHLWEKL